MRSHDLGSLAPETASVLIGVMGQFRKYLQFTLLRWRVVLIGPPAAREPDAVARDVADGKVGAAAVRSVYRSVV
jgi:hypothetical protein